MMRNEQQREIYRWMMKVESIIADQLRPERSVVHQWLDRIDPYRATIRLTTHLVVILFLVVSLAAQTLNPAMPTVQASALERWLDPQTLIAIALVLLYVGEVRGDMRRIKERLGQLTDEHLTTLFMPREVLEERLKRFERDTH